MKKICLFIAFILVVSLLFTACGKSGDDVSEPESAAASEEPSAEADTIEVRAHGIKLTVPKTYNVIQGETVYAVSPYGTDNFSIVAAAGSLDDFTRNNMTAALQTAFDFDSFTSYEKTEVNGTPAVVYSFETVVNGVQLYLKQLNVQVGETVVSVTYCLTDVANIEEFENVLQTVTLE
ncbi:MAG: hypothetical protein J6W93_07335 [Clostridia bacterium]|nr:hypothetical protein [Clostridia bacterium]MBP5755644.1 hypothetical protein [Clostridia bacterium]